MSDLADLAQNKIESDQAMAVAAVRSKLSGRGPAWIDGRPYCRECGAPMPAKRVEILPAAELCVGCQGEAERG